MKIPLPASLGLIFIAATCQLFGQTNVFPTTGSAGIGTTSPGSRKLKVQSSDSTNDVGVEVSLGRTTGTNYGLVVSTDGVGADLNQGILTTARDGSANFGLRIYNVLAASSNYALYSDSAAKSYFQGSIGIGTTTPGTALEIRGANSSGKGLLYVDGTDHGFVVANAPTAGVVGIAFGKAGVVNWSTGMAANDSSYYISAGASVGSNAALAVTSGGNVGLGTTSPVTGLHVKGAFTPGYMQVAIQTTAADDRAGISFLSSAGSRLASFYVGTDSHSYFSPAEAGNGVFHIYTAGSERMTFLPSGNIGIGTSSPTHKLAVNGTIRAHEVIVDTGWSDYVFADDYRLTPLAEVESQIKSEGHLPGIPSAREIAEHGVTVGEMQAKLLAKIEELTLHVIAQEKRVTAQEKHTADLEKENQALRREIVSLRNTRN